MLILEIDPKSGCGGWCEGCALSRVNMSSSFPESRVESISALQSLVIEATLATFTQLYENIHVNVWGCLMDYTDSNIPKFPDRTVEQITLYLETEQYDPQNFFDQLRLFLSAYPKLQRMRVSFFRGIKYVDQQVQVLRVLMAGMIPFLKSSLLQDMELFFWANDIPPDDCSFNAVDNAFTHVFVGSGLSFFRDDGTFSESRAAIKSNAFVFSDDLIPSDGNLQRVIALVTKNGAEKFLYVGLNRWTAQPKETTAEDMLQKIGNIRRPWVIHIGWNRVFPFHRPEFTQVPGAHVSNNEYLQMLQRFRVGEPWCDIVSSSIRARKG